MSYSLVRFLQFVKENKIDKVDDAMLLRGFSMCEDYCILVECKCSTMDEWKEFALELKKKMHEKGLGDIAGKILVVCPGCFR